MSFTERPDHELDQLSDEKLIAYMRAAFAAGEDDAGKRALAILIYGHAGIVERRMELRVPPEGAEEAAHEALVRAVGSTFDGSSVGEFRSWLGTIIERTAADWYRRRGRRPIEAPLGGERPGSEDAPGREPASADGSGAVELQIVVDGVMASLSDPHRRVVELHVLEALPAAEVCERVDGMKPDNVAQIASRFRRRLREELAAEDGGGGK